MSGDEAHRMGMVAMRQRNAECGSSRQRRRDAGHDRDADAVLFEFGDFFARTSEDHWISGFEANDMLARSRQLDHELVDVLLPTALALAALADRHALGLAAREFDDIRGYKVVVEDDIGCLQCPYGFERQQFGIARSGTDERDVAGLDGCRERQ